MTAGRATMAMLKTAWPKPSIDNLLRAITLRDKVKATAAWRDFENHADFDNLTQSEFRLISLAARRLKELEPGGRRQAIIAGIERAVWSRSQLAIGEATSSFRKLSDASVDMLVIKGAGRAASAHDAVRGRIVNDIDIVLHPQDFIRSFDLLIDDGWKPAGSGSILYNRSRLAHIVSINLVRGEFGNIDLHRTPFKVPFDSIVDDNAIWQRSLPGKLGYEKVRVPVHLDAILIAIAHGSLDAHKNSDWLADIAASIDMGIDWDLFLAIARRRRLQTAAAIALGYVRERLERPIPSNIMAELENAAGSDLIRLISTVAQARPKSDRFGVFWLARAVAKQSRLLRARRGHSRPSNVAIASPFQLLKATLPRDALALEANLLLPGRRPGEPWNGLARIDIVVDVPPVARRVEFEINTSDRHILRLRAFLRNRGRRQISLRFRTRLEVLPDDSEIFIQAVPARSFNSNVPPEKLDQYSATPFKVLRLQASSAH